MTHLAQVLVFAQASRKTDMALKRNMLFSDCAAARCFNTEWRLYTQELRHSPTIPNEQVIERTEWFPLRSDKYSMQLEVAHTD